MRWKYSWHEKLFMCPPHLDHMTTVQFWSGLPDHAQPDICDSALQFAFIEILDLFGMETKAAEATCIYIEFSPLKKAC